jgi:hypothetical protein
LASSVLTISESGAFDLHRLDDIESCDTRDSDRESAVLSALQARLAVLDKEIARLSDLGLNQQNAAGQESYLRLAQDLQREARAIREEIRKHSRSFVVQSFRHLLRRVYERLRNEIISSS